MGHPGTAKPGLLLTTYSKATQVSGTAPGWPATLCGLWSSLSHPQSLGRRTGTCWGSLATFCNGDVAGQGVPHLPPGSQLDEGTDGLVGAGPAGKHVAPVEGLEEADEVGTLRLLKGRCLLVV